jgi:hypothetical protein
MNAMAPKNTTAAGYGSEHQKLRNRWAVLIAQGGVWCWRCGRAILPGMLFDLGHDDWNRRVYRGPEHRYCNRAAGARKKQAMLRGGKALTKINTQTIDEAMINNTTDRW